MVRMILNKLPIALLYISFVHGCTINIHGSYEEFWDIGEKSDLEPWPIYLFNLILITNYTFTNEEFWQFWVYKEPIIFRSFLVFSFIKNNTIRVA